MSETPFAGRMERARDEMRRQGVDVMLLSVGADLPWLCGYEAMPLERITMLVVPADGDATLVVPALEAPRVVETGVATLLPWSETADPMEMISRLARGQRCALGDRTWARFALELQAAMPGRDWQSASTITSPLRSVKDAHEASILRRAARVVDDIAGQLQRGEIELVGRTEAQVSADLGARILDGGHHRVNFAIVAAGSHAASPHHEAGQRVIGEGDVVLCDFGGTMVDEWGVGYCSDITRCVWIGEPDSFASEVYAVLEAAQARAVGAAVEGATCEHVDQVARNHISEAGFGDAFVHRTGHGIGVEEHEDPYIVEGNQTSLVAGNAFSIEPGIYLPNRFGFRLEDIVLCTPAGPESLNQADHGLIAIH